MAGGEDTGRVRLAVAEQQVERLYRWGKIALGVLAVVVSSTWAIASYLGGKADAASLESVEARVSSVEEMHRRDDEERERARREREDIRKQLTEINHKADHVLGYVEALVGRKRK
jgi:hypothetical protein